MVAQVRIEPFGTRHLDVIADGKRYGSIELDGKLFLAKPYALPSEWFRTQDEAVAHIVETVGRLRARWQRALGRAIAEGLDPVAVASREGMWFVPSGSDLNVGYLVERNGITCTCPAGDGGDAVCKHRAAVRYVVGRLKLDGEGDGPEPEPPAPAARPCVFCNGLGRIDCGWTDRGEWLYRWEPCAKCSGTGRWVAA